jgi:hypothetical protein
MKFTFRTTRSLAAGAAIIGAAVLVPAIALAASGSPASPQVSKPQASSAVHRCLRAQLTAWIGVPGNGTAGSVYYPLEISNVSNRTCTLYGYPGVSALAPGGGQAGSPAGRSPGYQISTVTLAPYQTSHVDLQITDVGVYSPSACHPETADALKVYAPGDFSSMLVPFSFQACGKSGPVYLHVSPDFGNTGIPGYMNP